MRRKRLRHTLFIGLIAMMLALPAMQPATALAELGPITATCGDVTYSSDGHLHLSIHVSTPGDFGTGYVYNDSSIPSVENDFSFDVPFDGDVMFDFSGDLPVPGTELDFKAGSVVRRDGMAVDFQSLDFSCTIPPYPQIVASNMTIDLTSSEDYSGSLTGFVSGGVGAYAFELGDQGTIGTASVSRNGDFSYQAPEGPGTDRFTYAVSDAVGQVATGTVFLTIATPLPDALTAANLTVSTTAGEIASGDLMSLIDGGTAPFTFELDASAAHGTATVGEDGGFTYIAADTPGSDSFGYRVTDSASQVATGTVTVTIDADPLVATDLHLTMKPRESSSWTLLPHISGGVAPYAFALDSQATQGSATVSKDGQFTFVANPAASGHDSVTYTVSDGAGATTSGLVTIDYEARGRSFGYVFPGEGGQPDRDAACYRCGREGGSPSDNTGRTLTIPGSDDGSSDTAGGEGCTRCTPGWDD